jgi:hypothetical protein
MKAIICDICKGTIEQPILGRTLFHTAHIDVCIGCQDDLDTYTRKHLRQTEAEHKPFDFQWYNDFLVESLQKGIQRGKIEQVHL